MSKDYYKCECGKEFDNPQKFNGHKSHCKIHQLIKWGSLEHLEKRDKIFKKAASDINEIKKEESIRKKNIELISWLSSLPKCERCGKIMTQRFSCGRFCSRECANTRNHSQKTKNKISVGVLNSDKNKIGKKKRKENFILKYLSNPNKCQYCGKILDWEIRKLKYCSEECRKIGISTFSFEKLHTVDTSKHWRGNFKWGTYKGFWCDSSWELAFILYCLDNKIKVIQNNDSFSYIYNGRNHRYTPDFIVNSTYIEIKGYFTDKDKEKLLQFPKNKEIHMINGNEAKFYVDYARKNYGNKFFTLYDKNFPNWMNYQ